MSDMYLQHHQVHVKTKTKKKNQIKTDVLKQRVWTQTITKGWMLSCTKQNILSMLLTLTGFYLPEQPAEPPKPWRHKDVSADRKETNVRGKTGGKLVQMQKTSSQKQTSSWDLQCSPRIQNIHNPACWWPTNTQYQLIFSRVCYTCNQQILKNTTTEEDSGWVSLGHSELTIIQWSNYSAYISGQWCYIFILQCFQLKCMFTACLHHPDSSDRNIKIVPVYIVCICLKLANC